MWNLIRSFLVYMKMNTFVLVLIAVIFSFHTQAFPEDDNVISVVKTDKEGYSNILLIRDNCLSDFDKLQSVEEKYDVILAQYPLDPEALYCRGIIRVESGQYRTAISDFNTLIENNPCTEAYLGRADAWRRLGEIEKSDIDLVNVFRMSGTSAGYYTSAKMLQSMGRYQDAITDYKKSIELKPNKINAISDLAWLYATCEDKAFRDGTAALHLAQKVIIKIDGPKEYATLAVAYAELGDFDNARLFQGKAVVQAKGIYGSEAIQYFNDMLEKFYANESWKEPGFPTLYGTNKTDRR